MPDSWLEAIRFVYYCLASIGLTGASAWAVYKLLSFRTFKPSLDLSLDVQTHRVAGSKVYFLVTLTMKNTSKVKVDYGHSASFLHRLNGVGECDLQKLQNDATNSTSGEAMAWPLLDGLHSQRKKEAQKKEFELEPNATEQQYYEIIADLPDDAYVLVKCVVYDRRKRRLIRTFWRKHRGYVWPIQTIYRVGGDSNGQ